jgi:fructan beta-fructosidase
MHFKRILLLGMSFASLLACKGEKSEIPIVETPVVRAYGEPHRPRFHFTPPAQWMNDPNGMFYLNGEYHLSYQYYPDSTVWGPMHWGHAVSKDLVSWEHLPIALYPDSLGYIFSGSAVVDQQNTSGLATGDTPVVVAAFTHHDPVGEQAGMDDFQYQSLAFSPDGGRTWTKYAGNPVLPNETGIRDFRDPKLIWHDPTRKWIMALAVYDRVQFYASQDLKQWAYLSEFGIPGDTRLWECPDLFPLRDPETGETRWVLLVSIQKDAPNGGTATSYFLGDFDGTRFFADPARQQWLDWGTDNYAFVTWDNAPVSPDQRIGIGWMSNWQYAQQVPTEAWRSAMTVPRVLSLRREGEGYALASQPVGALESLRGDETRVGNRSIVGEQEVKGSFSPSQCELLLQTDLERTTAGLFGITLSNPAGDRLIIGLDREIGQVWVDRRNSGPKGFSETFFTGPHTAPLDFGGSTLDLRLLLDVASLELFAGQGKLNFTEVFFPETPFQTLTFWAQDGEWVLSDSRVYSLGGIWEGAR